MAANSKSVPGREQVLAVVWSLMQKAAEAVEPDHGACAKYAELLLKRGKDNGQNALPDDLMDEIRKTSAGGC